MHGPALFSPHRPRTPAALVACAAVLRSVLRSVVLGSVLGSVVLGILGSASCQTWESYGREYAGSGPLEGVPPASALVRRQQETAARRGAAFGEERTRELASCEFLRAQFVHASRTASSHVACVWGCPLAWPGHLVTLFFWPVMETQKAQAVWSTAERLEHAYQSDTGTFLSVCAEVKKTEIGRAFLGLPRPLGPRPAAP